MSDSHQVPRSAHLWRERVFRAQTSHPHPPEDAAFWSLTYHILFWLDVYLTGSHEGFAPPAPFTLNALDPASVFPEQPYTKDELHGYLVHLRKKWVQRFTAVGHSDFSPNPFTAP